jgi:lipoyl(octanoyl) transferase
MDYPLQEWRLLITPPAHGAWNMALDEAILEAVEQNLVPPTLRLYAWNPACLSIGYAQTFKEIDIISLAQNGWEWVRRPTGGRAILHVDELTYSVIAPLNEPRVAGGVLESYRRLSVALLAALHALGIPADAHPNIRIEQAQPHQAAVCFEIPSNYEIVVQGKKLVGSAQARKRNMLLQHGTLPLWGDLTRITQALTYDSQQNRTDAATRLLMHATTVELALGTKITWLEAAQAFITAFQSELNLDLNPAGLIEEETRHADELVRDKYAHHSWLERI